MEIHVQQLVKAALIMQLTIMRLSTIRSGSFKLCNIRNGDGLYKL
ncbi:MAG: hypothetical protein ACTTHM_03395 [Peptoanaerobacter stomatis]